MPENDHPAALSDGDRRRIKFKHVLMTTLKWAAIGALAVGGVAALGGLALAMIGIKAGGIWSLATAGAAAYIPGVSTALGWLAAPLLSMMKSTVISAALIGGAGAGLLGLFKGVSTADDKADIAEEDKMALWEQSQNRQRRLAALKLKQRELENYNTQLERQYGLPHAAMGRTGPARGMENG